MKTLFLPFCSALLIVIDSKKDEGYSLVRFDETNGKHTKWIRDSAGEKLITTISYLIWSSVWVLDSKVSPNTATSAKPTITTKTTNSTGTLTTWTVETNKPICEG